jgi:hypothetical protein
MSSNPMNAPYCFDIAFNSKARRVYRYNKAFVYVNGIPYYFTFRPQQCIDRPNLRIKDVALSIDDVKRLPWKKVSSIARLVVGTLKRPTCMRLKFSSKFNIHNSGQPVFLARTKRRLLRARCSC